MALRTADWKGAPVPAEVAVWAVDEGVLRLTAVADPDGTRHDLLALLHAAPPGPLDEAILLGAAAGLPARLSQAAHPPHDLGQAAGDAGETAGPAD